ncbi:MAG: hypothetical protein LCH54_09980 [Bacteroidetes bacterium]|nr:hypothetical protein [Bacteroidota bacterium]
MRFILIVSTFLIQSFLAVGQNYHADFSILGTKKSFGLNVAINRNLVSFWDDKITVYGGLRSGIWLTSDAVFVSAPPEFTSKSKSDTLSVGKSTLGSLNLMAGFEIKLAENWSSGFNIDLAGLTFGSSQTGTISGIKTETSPAPFNLLLVGTRDIGTLNSEFYLRWNWNDNFYFKGGFNHHFAEQKTKTEIQKGNDRFRQITNPIFVSVGLLF